MIWQDWVLSTGSLIFSIALVPTVLGKEKPAISTSLLTGSVLLIYAFVYATFSLWFSAISVMITGILWLTLLVKKYRQIKQVETLKN